MIIAVMHQLISNVGFFGYSFMPNNSTDLSCRPFIKAFIQGFLPGIALKIFLIFLPTILMMMSKFEGWLSISALERKSASKYYIFTIVNVFLGNIIAGAAFEQLSTFLNQSANQYVFNENILLHSPQPFFNL